MSFMEARSAVSICNKALSRISQAPLSGALDDPTNINRNSARECRLWYPTVVRQLLEKHHWDIATRHAPLALAPINKRQGEWLYAYLKPSDMAFPVGRSLLGASAGPIAYYWGVGALLASLYGRRLFQYEAGVIYSHQPIGQLDYVSYNITEADFNDTFESLVVGFLSAQLARSVAKDEALAKDFDEQATRALNLAIAQSLNLGGARYDQQISDSERARHGFYLTHDWGNLL